MGFKFSNIKKNIQKSQQDPYFALKFEYRMKRYFIYFIMIVVGFTFIQLIWNFNSSSSMGNVVRVFMIFVGGYMMYQIYIKTLLPIKKSIQHYDMSPSNIIAGETINVAQEVDDILNKFDKDGKRIK